MIWPCAAKHRGRWLAARIDMSRPPQVWLRGTAANNGAVTVVWENAAYFLAADQRLVGKRLAGPATRNAARDFGANRRRYGER